MHYLFKLLSLSLIAITTAVQAEITPGEKTISLKSNAGDSLVIGKVVFKQADKGLSYTLEMDDSKYSNHFLSMRPFKCLQGPSHMLCHLLYPYHKDQHISTDQLTPLEYDLLFIHRQASDYAIDPWNGIYYQLKPNDDGSLTGTLNEVDLNILAAPPDEGVQWPIGKSDLNAAEASSHSYPVLEIK